MAHSGCCVFWSIAFTLCSFLFRHGGRHIRQTWCIAGLMLVILRLCLQDGCKQLETNKRALITKDENGSGQPADDPSWVIIILTQGGLGYGDGNCTWVGPDWVMGWAGSRKNLILHPQLTHVWPADLVMDIWKILMSHPGYFIVKHQLYMPHFCWNSWGTSCLEKVSWKMN